MSNSRIKKGDFKTLGTATLCVGMIFNQATLAQSNDTQQANDTQQEASYTPDFRTQIGEHAVGVDIDLLGANGELTVGFLASLDPHHAQEWRKMPEEARHSTNPFRVHEMLAHMNEHEIPSRQIEAVYNAAHIEWVKKHRPDNAPPAPQEAPAPEHNHDH